MLYRINIVEGINQSLFNPQTETFRQNNQLLIYGLSSICILALNVFFVLPSI